MINSCVLVGRLCADPESRQTTSGMQVCNFRIAVNRRRKGEDGKDEADFLNIVAFDKTAQFVQQYMDKGALVGVEGRIQSRTWQTDGGETRYAVEIVANSVQGLESRREAEERRGQGGGQAQQPSQAQHAPQVQPGQVPTAGARVQHYTAPSTVGGGSEETGLGPDEDPFGD